MQYMALGSQEELREQIIELALERAFMQQALPVNAQQFTQRRDEGKARLNLLASEIARHASVILTAFHGIPKNSKASRRMQLRCMICNRNCRAY